MKAQPTGGTTIEIFGKEPILSAMSLERRLNAAQGYTELGMYSEALAELADIPAETQAANEILELKLFIHMRARNWEEALDVCARLRTLKPQNTLGYIHGAFCLHEMGRTQDAKQLLLDGPPALLKEATYFYNLGCYDAVLGNREVAFKYLETSFRMDKKFREIAKYDPDLKSVLDLM